MRGAVQRIWRARFQRSSLRRHSRIARRRLLPAASRALLPLGEIVRGSFDAHVLRHRARRQARNLCRNSPLVERSSENRAPRNAPAARGDDYCGFAQRPNSRRARQARARMGGRRLAGVRAATRNRATMARRSPGRARATGKEAKQGVARVSRRAPVGIFSPQNKTTSPGNMRQDSSRSGGLYCSGNPL